MALSSIIDALRTHILASVSPVPTTVGGVGPATTSELPAVILSVGEASRELAGIGRAPKLAATGALKIDTRINLGDPFLRFFSETGSVPLLFDGRTRVQAPHAPFVRADGTDPPPALTGTDLTARITGGTIFTVVSGTPTGNQVQPDPQAGMLRFGTALPASGTLELGYFLGQWEIRATRYQGLLSIEVVASTAAGADTLSRRVDQVLRQEQVGAVPGLNRIAPASWGIVGSNAVISSARARAFSYRFDYELLEPIIPTGGGVIARIEVDERYGGNDFVVTR